MGPVKRRQMVSALEAKGFQRDNRDHRYFTYYRSGRRTPVKTMVSHGRGGELADFIACPIGQADYERLLVGRKVLPPPTTRA